MKTSIKAIASALVASLVVAGPAAASGKGGAEINKLVRVKGTIAQVAASNPDVFSTLVFALGEAKLVDVLQGPGPFTVFAPTNDAFAKIPAEVLGNLVGDTAALTEVLLYHVAPGKQDLRYAFVPRDLRTVQGQEVFADRERNTLFINNSQVIGSAIVTDNGVIYVVDSVLLPQYR